MRKLVIIGLEQVFLQLVREQLDGLSDGQLQIRTVSLNEFGETVLQCDETVLYFLEGLREIVEKLFPAVNRYILGHRKNLVSNMRELFALTPGKRILVVNDVKHNTDEMTNDLEGMGLSHTFFSYRPDQPLPASIDLIVTAGEHGLIPHELGDRPVIDIGLRFISLETVFKLMDHFALPYSHAELARHYAQTMMMLSAKWPTLGRNRFRRPYWFGVHHETPAPVSFVDLIENSAAMRRCCRQARELAASDGPIHLTGEMGSGRFRLAQAIHNESPHRRGPFVAVNCAASTADTLTRELFGEQNGTTASSGLLERAENGTLCIEEVDRLPLPLQDRLARVIAEKSLVRGKATIGIHLRLITTASGPFTPPPTGKSSPNLLTLLGPRVCRLPPLRERLDDLDDLVRRYIHQQLHRPDVQVTPETMAALKACSWEGNVQELQHVLQQAVMMLEGDLLERRYLPYDIARNPEPRANRAQQPFLPAATADAFPELAETIVRYGFLAETEQILTIYARGKERNQAYGRTTMLTLLARHQIHLSHQQLRLKLERLNDHGLLIVRPGRGGTTISVKGERFLRYLQTADNRENNSTR
ncbi:MAG: sigma 54-interacting transcriptional regulator [Desulfopila sp.]